jgi:hypothetical protein
MEYRQYHNATLFRTLSLSDRLTTTTIPSNPHLYFSPYLLLLLDG